MTFNLQTVLLTLVVQGTMSAEEATLVYNRLIKKATGETDFYQSAQLINVELAAVRAMQRSMQRRIKSVETPDQPEPEDGEEVINLD